jgi:hypothetical protein
MARCFAGKEVGNLGWIRPVSENPNGEIEEYQMRFASGDIPHIFDIVRVPLKCCSPSPYQPENYLLGKGAWRKIGVFDRELIDRLCENPGKIWTNEPYVNRIPLSYFRRNILRSSLLLIKVEQLMLQKSNLKKQIRAIFNYRGIEYDLPVTDIGVETEFTNKQTGIYRITDKIIYLCISLGEPFQSDVDISPCCYKLVAGVIALAKQKEQTKGKSYSVAEIRKEYRNAYAKWTEEDDEKLRSEFKMGKDLVSLAGMFERKPGAIRSRLRKLGLTD